MTAVLWRTVLRLRFHLFQRHRHDRLVIEKIDGKPLIVLPGVFNPTLFGTTSFMLRHLSSDLFRDGIEVLDLGTGSGALALRAARLGARVCAVDTNPAAVRCARINALLHSLEDRLEVLEGDLFSPLSGRRFDLVLCNPPYHRGEPTTRLSQAFVATDLDQPLATGLGDHLSDRGYAVIVLSSLGQEERFLRSFADHGLVTEVIASERHVLETLRLYRVVTATHREP